MRRVRVPLAAQPGGGTEVTLASGAVDAYGRLTASYTPKTTTYPVKYADNGRYAAALFSRARSRTTRHACATAGPARADPALPCLCDQPPSRRFSASMTSFCSSSSLLVAPDRR